MRPDTAHPQDHTQGSLQIGLLLQSTALPDEHDTRESAQKFLYRAIELKEELMRKSSDDDAGEESETSEKNPLLHRDLPV